MHLTPYLYKIFVHFSIYFISFYFIDYLTLVLFPSFYLFWIFFLAPYSVNVVKTSWVTDMRLFFSNRSS